MKIKSWISVALICLSVITEAQNLREIFTGIPDSLFPGYNRAMRDTMVNDFMLNRTGPLLSEKMIKLEVFDQKNGYLKITGAFEGWIEVCFWNMQDGSRIIGVVTAGCGPVCECDLTFISLKSGIYKRLNTKDIVPPCGFSDFFSTKALKEAGINPQDVGKQFEQYSLLYTLPRYGKNITVSEQFSDFGDLADPSKFVLGEKIELIWDNGKFVKGRILKD